jgi:hypothetical protein
MPKLPKNIEEKITQELAKVSFRRVKYTNTVVSYQLNLETEISLFVDIKTAKTSVQVDFYNTHNLIGKGIYFCHFGMGEYADIKEAYLRIDGWFNLEKPESFEFVDVVCLFGAKHLIQDFGMIQKCLETEEKQELPEYCFGSENGLMYFGFLNAIYGKRERALELLEKFVNSTLEYQRQRIGTNLEYLNDEKNGKWFDFYRIRACKAVIEAIKTDKNSEEIKELVKFHTNLEEEESQRRHCK